MQAEVLYNADMSSDFATIWHKAVTIAERSLATIVFVAVAIFTIMSIPVLAAMDWSDMETFYALINRVLLVVIGMELVRMLVTHSIAAVLEMLAFVIARKMLKPDLSSLDIAFGVISFVALMASRHFFTERCFDSDASAESDSNHGRSDTQ